MAKLNIFKKRRLAKMNSMKAVPIRHNNISGYAKTSLYNEPTMEMASNEISKNFDERYKKESTIHLVEIDFILSNLIERTDFKIERDYHHYTLRREDNKGYIYYKIGNGNINIECNDYISKTNEYFHIADSTLYEKWYSKLEDMYFEQFNKSSKNALTSICNMINLSRKTKISKLIKDENKKGA